MKMFGHLLQLAAFACIVLMVYGHDEKDSRKEPLVFHRRSMPSMTKRSPPESSQPDQTQKPESEGKKKEINLFFFQSLIH